MSVTIHYNGKLDDRARLPELLDAARLFCAEQRWLYRDVDERILGQVERAVVTSETEVETEIESEAIVITNVESMTRMFPIDDSMVGILITIHPESEPVWLTFNEANELAYYMPLNEAGEYWELKSLFTETQFAGSDTHIAVCELLHMLQDDYFPNLHVYDESGYFESMDEQMLDRAFVDMDSVMDRFQDAGDASVDAETETAELMGAPPGPEDESKRKNTKIERGKKINVPNPQWKRGRGASARKI